jgi:hypothetical protein
MAIKRCDVEIKIVQIDTKKLKITGRRGGELIFSLNGQAVGSSRNIIGVRSSKPPETPGQLLVDCYRTRGIRALDVSRYHGVRNGKIVIKLDTHKKHLMNRINLYIMSPELQLIEHGTTRVCINKSSHRISKSASLYYRTKTTHQFSVVKIICCETFYLKHVSLGTF